MDTAPLRPLTFIPGCNTPGEVTRAQLRANVERDLKWLELEPLKDKPLVIVAGGPSLKERWPEILTREADILSLNNTYSFLMERGVTPDYWMLLDARAENVDFLRNVSHETIHYVAGQCHPSVFDALSGYDCRLFLTILPDTLEIVAHIDKPKHRLATNVGTVGIKALAWAYAKGYRELHLYGYDSSYAEDEHHAFPQALNDAATTIDVTVAGRTFKTTPTLAHQVNEFCALAGDMTRAHGFDINLHCDGLLPAMVDHSNDRGEVPLEEREAAKYREMWTHDAYRKVAPGMFHADRAIGELRMRLPSTVIDFGCGTGRAAAYFDEHGYHVIGVDFAENCLDPGWDFHFTKACLWKLPEWVSGDFGFCTDVMEHIPPEKVHDVLAGIAKRTQSAYFNISTVDDSLGALIGHKLHLTVMAAEDWEKLMRKYWSDVKCIPGKNDAVFVCKQPLEVK